MTGLGLAVVYSIPAAPNSFALKALPGKSVRETLKKEIRFGVSESRSTRSKSGCRRRVGNWDERVVNASTWVLESDLHRRLQLRLCSGWVLNLGIHFLRLSDLLLGLGRLPWESRHPVRCGVKCSSRYSVLPTEHDTTASGSYVVCIVDTRIWHPVNSKLVMIIIIYAA